MEEYNIKTLDLRFPLYVSNYIFIEIIFYSIIVYLVLYIWWLILIGLIYEKLN